MWWTPCKPAHERKVNISSGSIVLFFLYTLGNNIQRWALPPFSNDGHMLKLHRSSVLWWQKNSSQHLTCTVSYNTNILQIKCVIIVIQVNQDFTQANYRQGIPNPCWSSCFSHRIIYKEKKLSFNFAQNGLFLKARVLYKKKQASNKDYSQSGLPEQFSFLYAVAE